MLVDRRSVLASLSALGIGTMVFQRAAAALVQDTPAPNNVITAEMLKQAEWVAGITLKDEDREAVARALTGYRRGIDAARRVDLANEVPLAVRFDPTPNAAAPKQATVSVAARQKALKKPSEPEAIAFLSISELGHLLRSGQISSVELTQLYLERLRKFDPLLKCVITLTEDLALKQAKQADEELKQGKDRGPLHGIPWGAKDLIAVKDYKTTWGAGEYQEQMLAMTATVAERLEQAGAVLAAKLSLGALAYNDVWFGGRTNNPWNPQEGSSGSSAGSAAAVVAGLVGFTLGSETLGSIVSPSTRCGATGLRPTFGRVSRHGCMALCWTMDKIGPICRSVEDCALVLGAIQGRDGRDPTAVDRDYVWPSPKKLAALRVGVPGRNSDDRPEVKVLREIGVQVVPISLPQRQAGMIVNTILNAEAGAAFDHLTQAGKLEQIGKLWPTPFRAAQWITAVDYLRAQRLRSKLMDDMAKVFEQVDLYVGGNDLSTTNLTGHPSVCLPNGFTKRNGADVPISLTFTGQLFGEAELLAVAMAYQEATGFHLKRPPLNGT